MADPGPYKVAWEDGHLVWPDSPEADWYRESPGRTGKWCEDVTGAYVINPAYRDRGYGAGFGFDWGNLGTFFTGFAEGFSKGGGDMTSGFISAGGTQTSKATSELKKEIIAARNRWCTDRGIPIPGTVGMQTQTAGTGGQLQASTTVPTFKEWLVAVLAKKESGQ